VAISSLIQPHIIGRVLVRCRVKTWVTEGVCLRVHMMMTHLHVHRTPLVEPGPAALNTCM
jgi:hypothetical protein